MNSSVIICHRPSCGAPCDKDYPFACSAGCPPIIGEACALCGRPRKQGSRFCRAHLANRHLCDRVLRGLSRLRDRMGSGARMAVGLVLCLLPVAAAATDLELLAQRVEEAAYRAELAASRAEQSAAQAHASAQVAEQLAEDVEEQWETLSLRERARKQQSVIRNPISDSGVSAASAPTVMTIARASGPAKNTAKARAQPIFLRCYEADGAGELYVSENDTLLIPSDWTDPAQTQAYAEKLKRYQQSLEILNTAFRKVRELIPDEVDGWPVDMQPRCTLDQTKIEDEEGWTP